MSAELSLNLGKQAYYRKHAIFLERVSFNLHFAFEQFVYTERGPVFQESSIMQLRIGSVHDNT